MREFPFYWIDTFSSKKLGGNPCAVVLNADSLHFEDMLSFAREMNLSETAFVIRSHKADFGARYFTTQEELPFAGHPTVATIHALLQAGYIKNAESKISVTLELAAGIISVDIQQKK